MVLITVQLRLRTEFLVILGKIHKLPIGDLTPWQIDPVGKLI